MKTILQIHQLLERFDRHKHTHAIEIGLKGLEHRRDAIKGIAYAAISRLGDQHQFAVLANLHILGQLSTDNHIVSRQAFGAR